MKKYKCPDCLSTAFVVKFGYRGKTHRFLCRKCKRHFSINPHFISYKNILSDHLDGFSFRTLARKYDISHTQAWRICHEELKKLPDNNQFTFKHCNRFSSVFVFDGKYFNVADQKYDWALLWGIDYFRHDIPIFTIAPAENYQTWARYFSYFRIIQHHPELLVCDDNSGLKMAARSRFPQVKIQTCFNHFKENIRRALKVRSDITYKPFMKRIELILKDKLSDEVFNKWMGSLYVDYKHDAVCLSVLTNIERYKSELLAYRGVTAAPVTNNLMEGLNGHLEARLHSLRSFQTVEYARLWLNGYVLKRKTTKFTDCRGKFRSLNGKSGLEMTKKLEIVVPTFF